jgi:broad specificity phosphatase PhoE
MTNNKPVTIYLIRHGEANAAWDEDPDPGLSEKGKLQSEELKTELAQQLPSSFEAISSPLLRAQETAKPLKETLGFDLNINDPLSERRDWLRGIFNAKVKELEEPQLLWRNSIIESLKVLQKDTIIFSHFMVINCVVGWIKNSEKFVSFHPDNCSVTKIRREKDEFEILNMGRDFTTTVQ